MTVGCLRTGERLVVLGDAGVCGRVLCVCAAVVFETIVVLSLLRAPVILSASPEVEAKPDGDEQRDADADTDADADCDRVVAGVRGGSGGGRGGARCVG